MELIAAQRLLGIAEDGKWGQESYRSVAAGLRRDAATRTALLDLKLSPHFTLKEMIYSSNQMRDWATRNLPNMSQVKALVALCHNILEPVRNQFGPVRVTSGLRIWTPNSQHGLGEAADFEVPGVSNLTVCRWIVEYVIFDQLIREGYSGGGINDGWIHASYRIGRARKSILRTPNGRAPYMNGLGN